MNDRFESLDDGEVISVQHDSQVLSGHRTFRAGELSETIEKLLESAIPGWNEEKRDWLTAQGIDCEALRFGSKGWEKGRIKFSLQFCPDEPVATQEAISSSSNLPTKQLPAEQAIGSLAAAAEIQHEDILIQSAHQQAVPATIDNSSAPPNIDRNFPETLIAAIPVAGVATMSAAVAVAVATPVPEVSTNSTIPHHTDTILELEDGHSDPSAPNSGGLDEISFDFDSTNKDRGRMIPNGGMVLDLNDIGLDFSEHDLLSFEANGLDGAEGFGNLQDFDRPENSGMLIDEVWNEMNQNNWPGIN